MSKKLFISFIHCSHCKKEISIAYSKKAIKKIYKSITHKPDTAVDLFTIDHGDGNFIVCLKSEVSR